MTTSVLREDRKGRRIRGHFSNGWTATATWDDWDEWTDDKFGEGFSLDESLIGAPSAAVLAHCKHSFWDGCERVEWLAAEDTSRGWSRL